jgi:MOSC domain-containing protein YiiM
MPNDETITARIVGLQRSNGGVPKLPIPSAEVTRLGIMGDAQRDRRHHGGPDRALCLYSQEVMERLNAEGHPIRPGTAGENVTIQGLEWSAVKPGKRYRLGSEVEIEITDYTTPCLNIVESFADGEFSRILQKTHPGESRVYARVLKEGSLRLGDAVAELAV